MNAVFPSIAPEVAVLAPGFRALSISVQGSPIIDTALGTQALFDACQHVIAGGPTWADAHLCAWDDIFRKFGSKPQQTPCSAKALRKRVLKTGSLPSIDPIVDLYNAVSLKYALPVGGENFASYVGMPRLVIANGTEEFDTVRDGELISEAPEPGEVIWRDDLGVTCRRWNWRQGLRTRLTAEAELMWFVLESLSDMPLAAFHAAGEALTQGLRLMMPDATVESRLINPDIE